MAEVAWLVGGMLALDLDFDSRCRAVYYFVERSLQTLNQNSVGVHSLPTSPDAPPPTPPCLNAGVSDVVWRTHSEPSIGWLKVVVCLN